MSSEFIEISDISKIKENVLNYNVFNNKMYVDTKNKRYVIDYSLENEEKLVDNLSNYINMLKSDINDKEKEIKVFETGFTVDLLCAFLSIMSVIFIPKIISLILLAPFVFYGCKINLILKQLNSELNDICDETGRLGLTLECKKIDLELNTKIDLEKKKEQEKYNSVLNKLEELKNYIEHFGNEDNNSKKGKRKALKID